MNCMFDAVYARQSVDKADSISIESQFEFCCKETEGHKVRFYSDKGYSGKNTERPAFRELITDIESGLISRVIVYRLDRISRSVLDFANLVNIFQKYNVAFISAMEKFDTSTPIGNAMLMIVMIFAQLERETIQQRITDAYASRSKRGLYMGGALPYGFRLTDTVIDGVKSKMYRVNEAEANIVEIIYSLYKKPETSLGDIARILKEKGLDRGGGKMFTACRVRDIVINPVYVKADFSIYDFFKKQGASIINPPEDFVGINGIYLYTGDGEKRKTVSLQGHNVVLAPHEGIVDSETWLKCRKKCLNNSSISKASKAKQSWLAGKIKCGYCGYALTAKTYQRKTKADKRYFFCSNKHSAGECSFRSLDAELAEEAVLEQLEKKLADFPLLRCNSENKPDADKVKLMIQLERVESEIDGLVNKIGEADETLMRYINVRVNELHGEKQIIEKKINGSRAASAKKEATIKNYFETWYELSMGEKIIVFDCLAEFVSATENCLKIHWKI